MSHSTFYVKTQFEDEKPEIHLVGLSGVDDYTLCGVIVSEDSPNKAEYLEDASHTINCKSCLELISNVQVLLSKNPTMSRQTVSRPKVKFFRS